MIRVFFEQKRIAIDAGEGGERGRLRLRSDDSKELKMTRSHEPNELPPRIQAAFFFLFFLLILLG